MSNSSAKKRGLPMRVKMRHDTHFVEELAARHETPVGRMMPLTSVEPDPDQPRTSMGDLSELVASIQEKGILEPILVRPLSEEEREGSVTHRIISGERRFQAAQEAGLFEVPAIEMDVSEEEALEIALIENLQRKDLTPFEEAEGYRALGDRHGYTHDQIATAVSKSRTTITESLALLKLPPRVRDAVVALGIQSKSILLAVRKQPDEAAMIALLERVATEGLSRDDLRKATSKARTGGRRKPYTFKFRAPDKTFNLALSFRKSEVDRDDLISALEQILTDLRNRDD